MAWSWYPTKVHPDRQCSMECIHQRDSFHWHQHSWWWRRSTLFIEMHSISYCCWDKDQRRENCSGNKWDLQIINQQEDIYLSRCCIHRWSYWYRNSTFECTGSLWDHSLQLHIEFLSNHRLWIVELLIPHTLTVDRINDHSIQADGVT